ncbi:CBS domain-containing protein [Paenibacillus shirakamiensis]|uniref:CBS domain-containing protein n=1 Tax=Paenibacillus shirakamiensis TaxID=1265935 RepID=A0ABS4JDF3_9BACL|nr:CBS domain-containing protein [Paenibacillus shirakamiensis]MBP1999105.1 CBS domain-containing protein [Paenibacillus shirakamiensis]
MKVRQFMIQTPVTASGSTTLRELLQLLVDNKIGGVPVVNEEHQLIGMISDGDVLRYIRPMSGRVYDFFSYTIQTDAQTLDESVTSKLQTRVDKVMVKKGLYKVSSNDPIDTALDILSKHHFKKIPVVDGDKVVGVISRGDVIRQLVNTYVLDSPSPS